MGEKDDLNNQQSSISAAQYSLDDPLVKKDLKRNKSFFDSLRASSSNGLMGIIGAFIIVAGAIGAGYWVNTTTDDNVEDTSVSSEECLENEIKIYTSTGFYCHKCKDGEYSSYDECVDKNPDSYCNKDDEGCFFPSDVQLLP